MSAITPFAFSVTPISPLFYLSPVASNTNDTSLGWAPSCTTPNCLRTASWSTSATNSTLSFRYWGGGVAFDGRVEGNMSIQFFRDGMQVPWNPSRDTLFSWPDKPLDYFYLHNITLKVVDTSPGALLTVNRVQVNGSSLNNNGLPAYRWTVPSSNKDRLKYTGFIREASEARTGSLTTYMSSTAGDTVSMQFNASTLLVYGPCGPETGLMRVTIDGQQDIVNTSKPFASSDCLLFQAWGLQNYHLHRLLIENIDGKVLGINRVEHLWVPLAGGQNRPDTVSRAMAVACGIASVLVACIIMMVVYVTKFVKDRQSLHGPHASRHWFQLLSS